MQENWNAPPLDTDFSCNVIIAQNFRGEVLDVGVEDCTRDDLAIQKSAEDAVYDASPLPLPGNRSCFVRSVRFTLMRRATDGK